MGKPEKQNQENQKVILQVLLVLNHKLNLLIEHEGLGDKLEALAETLHGPTEALRQAVEANQLKKEKEDNA